VTDAVRAVLSEIMREAVAMYDKTDLSDDQFADRVRMHVLDRWYRFSPYVESRAQLEPIRVIIQWGDAYAAEGWGVDFKQTKCRRTSVHVHGTPLYTGK